MSGLFSPLPATKAYEQQQTLINTLYARYCDIMQSTDFRRYHDLKPQIESAEHRNELAAIRALSYRNSTEYRQERRLKELRRNKDVKAFCRSGIDSDAESVREYIALEETVNTPHFRERKAFLQNKKRHLQSTPYLLLQEYNRLDRSKPIRQYFKLRRKYRSVFDDIESHQQLFHDDFRLDKLSDKWDTRPYWSAEMLDRNYSYNAEEHLLSEGRNVELTGSTVQIETRRETATGLAWDEQLGFAPRTFDYTSGMMRTDLPLELSSSGRLEIKLRFPNTKNIYSVCWLGIDRTLPAISVAHYCNRRLVMGAYTAESTNAVTKKWKLKSNTFYIFRIERAANNMLSWYINGKKIFSCPAPHTAPMYLALASGVLGRTVDRQLPAAFICDYVKVSLRIKDK